MIKVQEEQSVKERKKMVGFQLVKPDFHCFSQTVFSIFLQVNAEKFQTTLKNKKEERTKKILFL